MKKYILKYLSFLLVLSVSLQLPVQAEEGLYTSKEKQRYQDCSQLLIKLGILDEQKDITATVTRAEYARVLVSLSYGESLFGSEEYMGFTDVTKQTKYAEYIYTGAQVNLLTGYGDGTFRPDEMVKTEEAIAGLVKAAGYEICAEQEGGYTKGYISVASKIGLLDGTGIYLGYDITYGLLVELVMNSLDIDSLQLTFAGNVKYELGENKFVKRLRIEKRTGIVEATEKSSLYSETGAGKNSVTIDGNNYSVENNYNDLLGYCVEYYVDVKNYEDKIVYMNKKVGRNSEMTIYSKDIENYFNREYEYIKNNRTKKLRIPNDIAIIYNGVCEPEPTDAMMLPENGQITFVDNDNDGDYDALFITQYETYVVYFVDTINEKVYDMFDSSKVLSFDDNEFSIKDIKGIQKDLKDLKKWNVLSVKQSVNKAVTEITVCEDSVRGTVQETTDDEIVISGIRYEFSKDIAVGDIRAGKEGTFFFDCFNKIVAMSASSGNGMEIGYLADARIVDDGEEMVRLKIYDSTGKMVILYTAEKVRMDNVPKVTPQVILSNLKKDTQAILPQVIMFGCNNEGRINKIDTAYNNKPIDSGNIFEVSPENGETQDSLRLVYPSGAMYYRSAQKTFDGKINLTDSTIIFSVPESMADVDEDDFKIVGVGSLEGDQQYNCEFYSLGENNTYADICVVKGKNSVGAVKRYGVVTKISYTIDENDELVNEIRLTDYSGSIVGRAYGDETTNIDKGDFVECSISQNNEIVSITLVYDESTKTFSPTNPIGVSFNEPRRLLLGYVYSKENNIIAVSKDPITGAVNRTDLENHTIDKYKCYGFEEDYLREIKPEEVLDYKHTGISDSKVLIYTYYGEPRMLVVYK